MNNALNIVHSNRPVFRGADNNMVEAAGSLAPAIAREVAQIQGAIMVAKTCPRNASIAMDKIESACSRPTLADQALYAYPRGGSVVTGPSIRLAEALAQSWGNIKYGFEVLESTAKTNKVRAYAIDLETNTSSERIFVVENKRDSAGSVKDILGQRDIYENIASQAQRKVRGCILQVIPADIVEYAVAQIKATRENDNSLSTEKIKSMVDYFEAKHGVTKAQLEEFLKRPIINISRSQLANLKAIASSLKDGEAQVSDFFKVAPSEVAKKGSIAQQNEPTANAENGHREEALEEGATDELDFFGN